METVKQSQVFVSLILLMAIVLHIWTVNSNKGQYDISQLEPSRYGNINTNEFNVEISGDAELSARKAKFTVTLRNGSDDVLYYGAPYVIEVLSDGKWYEIPSKEDVVLFPLIKYDLRPNSERDFEVYLGMYECLPGKHRLVKEFTREKPILETGEKEGINIIVEWEFNIH